MGVKNKQVKLNIDLIASDNVEIKVNTVSIFNETIATGCKGTINTNYEESEI